METIFIALIAWILYCCFQGFTEAHYFSHGVGHFLKQLNRDIHGVLLAFRSYIWFCFLGFLFLSGLPFMVLFKTGLALVLLFPFFHEGTYYVSRKLIDNPDKYPANVLAAWTYTSTTSTAKLNFVFWVRLLAVIVAIPLLM